MKNLPNILEILNEHAEYKMSQMKTPAELKGEIDKLIGMLSTRTCDRQAATILLGIYSFYYFQVLEKKGVDEANGWLQGVTN